MFKKILISLLIITSLIPSTAQAVVVTGSLASFLFLGEVYALAAPSISGLTAMGKTVAVQSIMSDSEKTLDSYIQKIGEMVERKESEAQFADTTEQAMEATNEAVALRESQIYYTNLLYSLRNNKAIVIKETLLNEAIGTAKGYVKGKIASYFIDDDAIELVHGLASDSNSTAKKLIEGEGLSEEEQAANQEFFSMLKEGRSTPMKVAITKAEWDKFVNVTAKEEFKEYLRGENDFFSKLPMSVQEKYWKKLFMLTPSDMENIHDIMANAKRTGNYAAALKVVTEKYPYYKQTFTDLTKDLVGDSEKLTEKITQGVREKAQNQEKELIQAKAEQEESKGTTQTNDYGFLSDEEITKFMNDYINCINAKDLEGALSYYHPDWTSGSRFKLSYAQGLLATRLGHDDFNGYTWLWVVSDFKILDIDKYGGSNAIRFGYSADTIRVEWEWNSAHRIIETQPEFGEKKITKATAKLQKNDQGEWKFTTGGMFSDQ